MKIENLKTVQLHIRTTEYIKSLLSQRAKDEHISESEVVGKALTLYLTKDTMDESLLIAKITDISRQVNFLQRKLDIKEKLDLEWYQYFFLFSPELPTDQKELSLRVAKANRDVGQFLKAFKHHVKNMKPLIETLFGDMLEEDVEGK